MKLQQRNVMEQNGTYLVESIYIQISQYCLTDTFKNATTSNDLKLEKYSS